MTDTNTQPTRHRDESPIEFYRRTGWCPGNFMRRHKGRYYCNPAHCRRTWMNKAARDAHVTSAYEALA